MAHHDRESGTSPGTPAGATAVASSPGEGPIAQPGSRRWLRAFLIADAVVLVLAIAAWFLVPWRGPWGLGLMTPGNEVSACTAESGATSQSAGVLLGSARDMQGVQLMGVDLPGGAVNLRIIDARVRPLSERQSAIGLWPYPPVGADLVPQDEWDAAPQAAGFEPGKQAWRYELVVSVQMIDPGRPAQTPGFAVRYRQLGRRFTADTGTVLKLTAATDKSCLTTG